MSKGGWPSADRTKEKTMGILDDGPVDADTRGLAEAFETGVPVHAGQTCSDSGTGEVECRIGQARFRCILCGAQNAHATAALTGLTLGTGVSGRRGR